MKRRSTMTALGSGAALLTSGCLSVALTPSQPVHFELWNKTESAHDVAVTIRDDGGEVVLDRTYHIEDASAGPPGGNVIREEAFTEATNDALFDVEVTLDRRVQWDHRFRVMCNGREPENRFLAEITPGREPSVTFAQSTCG